MNHNLSRHIEAADRFHSAAIHALRHVRRADPATGLSPARLSALSVLVFGGPRTLGELAAAEQVRPATMTRIAQPVELNGHVSPAYLYVRVEDLEGTIERLRGAGARPLSPRGDRNWGDEAA